MTGVYVTTSLRDQFNAFLRAALWLDRDAAPLSVLSALARLDVDPWEEAAQLAKLAEESACAKLAAMLSNLPGAPSLRQDLEGLCVRSVRLLPRAGQWPRGARLRPEIVCRDVACFPVACIAWRLAAVSVTGVARIILELAWPAAA